VFSLVQRLAAAPDGMPKNIMGDPTSRYVSRHLLSAGAQVDLEYMARDEFNDPELLVGGANRIAAAAHRLQIVTRTLTRPGYTEPVHFICTEEQRVLFPKWDSWSQDPSTVEPTGYFRDLGPAYDETVGWWGLEEDLIWTREEEVAETIRAAFVTILERVS